VCDAAFAAGMYRDRGRLPVTSSPIFENCIVKNFHVPKHESGPCAYFRVRMDAISKKTVIAFTNPNS
jgi:hypothetical protein